MAPWRNREKRESEDRQATRKRKGHSWICFKDRRAARN